MVVAIVLYIVTLLVRVCNVETEGKMMITIEDRAKIVFLCDNLSLQLTTSLCGSRNVVNMRLWRDGTKVRTLPTEAQLQRMRFAHRMFKLIAAKRGADVAREWFTSKPSRLGNNMPSAMICNDRFKVVETHVQAFASTRTAKVRLPGASRRVSAGV